MVWIVLIFSAGLEKKVGLFLSLNFLVIQLDGNRNAYHRRWLNHHAHSELDGALYWVLRLFDNRWLLDVSCDRNELRFRRDWLLV